MPGKVELESRLEPFSSDPVIEHVDDRGALRVGDVVKDLIYLARVLHPVWDFNCVRAVQGVKVEGGESLYREELVPDVEVGADVICGKEGGPGGKTFFQPELIPPGKRHQIAKPLMSDLGHKLQKLSEGEKNFHLMGDQNGNIFP